MTDFRGEVINNETITRGRRIINSLSASEYHALDFTEDDNFIRHLTLRLMWLRLGVQGKTWSYLGVPNSEVVDFTEGG